MDQKFNIAKRAITMLLLLTMIVSMIPLNSFVVADTGISFTEMEVGVLYNAELNYSKYTNMYLYADGEGANKLFDTVSKMNLPSNLIVVKLQASDSYLYVTNEDWPSDFDSYRYVDPAELTIISEVAIEEEAQPNDGLVRGEVQLIIDDEQANSVALDEGEKIHIFTKLSEVVGVNVTYQWQLRAPNGEWATISDYILPYATISESLIRNARDKNGETAVRCLVTTKTGISYVSNELKITEKEEVAATAYSLKKRVNNITVDNESMADEEAIPVADDENTTTDAFQITIVYEFLHENPANPAHNGSMAANTFTLSFGKGDHYTGDIISPPIPGYKPYREVMAGEQVNATDITYYGGKALVPADTYHFQNQGDKIIVTVYYVPQTVYYRVQYYKQNPQDDNYTDWKTEYKEGIPDTAVGESLAPAETGFNALAYDKEAIITNDGMTVIEVYYDRIYYLVKYDIGEESYGVMPNYVRYGTTVMLGSPTNPGYAFSSWELTSVKDTIDGDELLENNNYSQYKVTSAYSQITVAHNLVYTAKWTKANTSYTIVYWLEDPEFVDPTDGSEPDKAEKYKVWGTETKTNVVSGSVVNGPASGSVPTSLTTTQNAVVKAEDNKTRNVNLLNYLDFISSDQNVTVKGDGSTIVNVYYDRKEYTLKFYYARKVGNQWSICGRTNLFGNEATVNNKNDELTLLNAISSDFGKVKNQPTFKDGVDTSKYTISHDTSGNTEYHYLSFKAKYGQDISDLYPCNIFNSVERTSDNTGAKNNLPAIMSAWTGEYNVAFSNVGGNQTMKGKFQILDYRMLWHPNNSGTGWNSAYNDQTVSYLCFWENANNAGWNIPELYRYKIWVPLLDGETPPAITTTGLTTMVRNNVTYYLLDWYDTCDNSTVKEQTQPTLKGFTANGRLPTENDPTSIFSMNSVPSYLTQAEYNEIRSTEMRSEYDNAYVVNYFYTRNQYTLTFYDSYQNYVEKKVYYQEDLQKYSTEVPAYPSSVEKNAIVFEGDGTGTGWYQDKGLALEFSFNQKMDVSNIQLYAKWTPTEWNVQVYMDEAMTHQVFNQNVAFGTLIPEPDYNAYQDNNPEYQDLIFAGWYYTDENGNDVRFDFNTMAIKQSYVVFAKWTSTVPIEYLVRYVVEDGEGGYIDIADPSKGVSLVGVTKSFIPKVADELYSEYRKYLPTARSMSKEMSTNADENTVYFVYVTVDKVTYTVKHIFESDQLINLYGTDTYTVSWDYEMSGSSNTFSGRIEIKFDANLETNIKNHKNEGRKLWEIVKTLSPNAYRQEIILIAGEDGTVEVNEVVFTWEDRGATFMYQEIHYFETLTDGVYTAKIYRDCIGTYDTTNNSTVTATHDEDIQGFTRSTKKHGNSTTVSKTFKKTDTGERVLELYYDRVTYNYKVEYKYGNTPLTTSVTRTAKYEEQVTENALEFEGYTVDGASTQTVAITFEGQIITFYYAAEKVIFNYSIIGGLGGSVSNPQERININEIAGGSTPSAFTGYIFEGWYTDAAGTVPANPNWIDENGKITPVPTVADADKSITFFAKFVPTALTINNSVTADSPPDEDQVFVYLIQGNGIALRIAISGVQGSQTIYGLPLGSYTITVEGDWSWRYDAVNSSANITFDKSNATVETTFEYNLINDTIIGDVDSSVN